MQKVKEIINTGESNGIEFKRDFDNESIITLVAFANTKGGKILIGVTDDRKVEGLKLGNETTQKTTQKTTLRQKIIEVIKADKFTTRESIAEVLAISPNTVKEYIARLKKEQKIKRVGGDKGGYWEVLA